MEHYKKSKKTAKIRPHNESNCFRLTKKNLDQYKFSISVIDEDISMDNQVSSDQSTGELTMATVKAQAEMDDFYAITSDQSISANKLKTNENGSISVEKSIKVFEDLSRKMFMFSKEVSFQNYVIQTLPCILTTDNVSAFFQEINKSKLCPGNKL